MQAQHPIIGILNSTRVPHGASPPPAYDNGSMVAGSQVVEAAAEKTAALEAALSRVIRGKPEAVRSAVVCLLARGHLLIEDVPGVGKTTLAQALALSIDCGFHRIQFTSDMLPGDVLGVTVYSRSREEFEFKRGPIFTNILLADEINRTTPKTQSALLEAMNEEQVTIERRSYPLPEPFMVAATQNPIEYHGTYPLPEAQLDRFLMRVEMGYPSGASEKEILRRGGRREALDGLEAVLSADDVRQLQALAHGVRVDEAVVDYLIAIVDATRRHERLALGVSPRGSLALYRAAQALALVEGLYYCTPHHVKQLAAPVFGHRVVTRNSLGDGAGGSRSSRVIEEILQTIAVPL